MLTHITRTFGTVSRKSRRRNGFRVPVAGIESLENREMLSGHAVVAPDAPQDDHNIADAPEAAPNAAAGQNNAQAANADPLPPDVRNWLTDDEQKVVDKAQQDYDAAGADLLQKMADALAANTAAQDCCAEVARLRQAMLDAFRERKDAKNQLSRIQQQAKQEIDAIKRDLAQAKADYNRFQQDAANLLQSGLIARWTAKYGANSHQVQQAKNVLQQQLDGMKEARDRMIDLKNQLAAKKASWGAAVSAAWKNLAEKNKAYADAKTAWLRAKADCDAKKAAATAANNAVQMCAQKLVQLKADLDDKIDKAMQQAATAEQQAYDRLHDAIECFRKAAQEFQEKLDEYNGRRELINALGEWFQFLSNLAGELPEDPDPTKALDIGGKLLQAASDFLFPGLSSLPQNSKGEYEFDQAAQIQAHEVAEAANKLRAAERKLDAAMKAAQGVPNSN